MRHPTHFGARLMFIGAPLLLGSAWGLMVGVGLVLLLVGEHSAGSFVW